jgi:O-antigen/teichoic acid export membrane protein
MAASAEQPTGTISLRRSFAYSVVERYLTTVIQFASTLVIARLLKPEEVGIFSVGMSIVALLHTVRDFGMTQYIVQQKELTRTHFRAAIAVTVAISVCFAIALWFTADAVAAFYREPALVPVLHLLAVALLMAPLYAPAAARLEREMNFATLLKIGSASALTAAVMSVALAFLGFSYMAMVWGSVLGNLVGLLILLSFRWRDVLTRPSFTGWRPVLSFGVQATGVALLSMFGIQAALLIMPRYLGFAAAGLYGRGHGLVSLFTRDVVGTVYRVLVPGFAHIHRSGGDLKGQYLKSVTYLTGLAWPFYAVMALVAEPVIVVLFGPAWAEAATVTRVLCLAHAIYTTWSTSTQVIIGLGKINKMLTGEMVQQPLRIALVFVAAQWGMVEVAWAQVATMTVAAVLYFHRVFPLLEISMRDILRATRPSALVAVWTIVPVAAMFYMTETWIGSASARLAAVALTAVLAWVSGIAVVDHPLKSELLRVSAWTRRPGRVAG